MLAIGQFLSLCSLATRLNHRNYQHEQLRKGADDDVVVNLRISEVISDHGVADTYRGMVTLRIKALCCQVLSNKNYLLG